MTDATGPDLLRYVMERRAAGLTNHQVAAELGIEFKLLERRITVARRAAKARESSQHNQYNDAPFKIDFGQPPFALEGDFLAIGDVHVPCTDYEFAQLPSLAAQKYLKPPRKLIIGGDLFNMDAFSQYAAVIPAPTWKQEKESARQLIREWSEFFEEIYFFMGNHDWRLLKWSMAQLDDDDLLTYLKSDKVRVSHYRHCTVRTSNGVWRITHPRNYSINALTVANDLAQKHGQHILSFHEHHAGITTDRYGRHIIVNGGCLADPNKLAYVALDDGKSPVMKRGFTVVRDGYPYLFADGITDWSKWI